MAGKRPERPIKDASTAGEGPLRAAPLGALGPLAPEGQGLPTFATLDGAPVAVLALDDYRRLVAAATTAVAPPLKRPETPDGKRTARAVSTVQRDPEVAAFLLDLFGRHTTVEQARAACLARFGEARTPSAGRISTFRLRTR